MQQYKLSHSNTDALADEVCHNVIWEKVYEYSKWIGFKFTM